MNRPCSSAILILITCVAACASTPKVGYDYDPDAKIGTYRTYQWTERAQEEPGDKRVDNPLVDGRIRRVVTAQLHAKGYTVPADGRPDFYVTYHADVKDMMIGSSSQHYIGDLAHGTYTTLNDIRATNQGILLVDVIDGASNRLVWRGFAQAEIDPSWSPERRNERMARVIADMFAFFPPK